MGLLRKKSVLLLCALLLSAEAKPCRLAYWSTLSWPTTSEPIPLALNRDGTGTWEGYPIEKFVTPDTHHRGVQHAAIYRVLRPEGPTLIKVLGSDDGVPQKNLDQALRGALLGQEVGGAKIRQVGTLRYPSGQRFHFIEMNELFPGQETSTFKGLLKPRGNRSNDLLSGEPRLTRRLARLMLKAYAAGIILNNDVDIIFSKNDAAWLDTAGWYYARPLQRNQVSPVGFVHFKLSSGDKEVARAFRQDWLEELETFPGLSPADRDILRDVMQSRD